MEILTVKDLSFTYPGAAAKAVDGVSFSLVQGDFLAVCGATGSGKSTLMSLIKRELAPLGDMRGEIYINGVFASTMTDRESAMSVGYVMQNPEHQTVTDKVWHELAFGLENIGVPDGEMKRRIAEAASFFGLEELYERPVDELSGGQKQLLALASVMVMQPKILILDEPTSQLDPIAASDFIAAVRRLCTELTMTVIMIEHRLEEVIPVSNKLLVLDRGRTVAFGETRATVKKLREHPELIEFLPAATRLFLRFDSAGEAPLTNSEGRAFITSTFSNEIRSLPEPEAGGKADSAPALEMKKVYFRYRKDGSDVLRALDIDVRQGEIFCLLGGSGSGKSTMLSAAAGLIRPYSGSVKVFGKKIKEYGGALYRNNLAMLAQDVQTVFLKNTVGEELAEMKGEALELPFDVSALADRHPYDLSGGEQQLAALAKVLMTEPRLLLLDEPTKGLDAGTRKKFAGILKKLKERGVTVLVVTHDVEFAASVADRCALLFRGEVVSCGAPESFFAGNNFYTTAVSRMTRGYYDRIITTDAAEEICRLNLK